MRLFAFFTNAGVPALGLAPTIDVWDSAGNHPVNAQAMAEIAGGWYQYNFAAYNDTVDYVIRADGGAGLPDFERYVFGSNECDSSVAESELNIRAGADTLDSLSDQLDVVALEAGVEGHVTNSLDTYDPPTRAEATADRDTILADLTTTETLTLDGLGISGQNVVWTAMTHDGNHNLTAATITQYTDNTLITIRKQWTLTATYDAASELTSYDLVEV